MQLHHYLIVAGIVASLLLAFGGFYNRVVDRRFDSLERWVKQHEHKFEQINGRCMAEISKSSGLYEKLEAVIERLDRLEIKLDRVLNGRLKD